MKYIISILFLVFFSTVFKSQKRLIQNIDISGTVYTDEAKTTPIATATSVAVSVNGATPITTTTNSSGQFSVTSSVNPNDVIIAYLDSPGGVSYFHALHTSATGTNITEGNGNTDLGVTNLLDNSNGSDSGYGIDINWSANGTNNNNTDNDPASGTDAYAIFNSKIDLGIDNAYQNNGSLIITFSNLNINKKYGVAIYSTIGGFSQYSNRFVLGGVSSAAQASSLGTNIVDNLTVEYDFDNTTDGYVAKWIDIDPTGTEFTITITSATSDFLCGPNAIYFEEQPPANSPASLVTITDGITNLTGDNELELVTNKIILEHQTATFITNAHLDLIDNADAENADGITITAGNATFAQNREVWISSGKTYNPGGDITLDNIEILGNLSAASNSITVNGNWNNNGGSFTAGTSSVTFSANTASLVSGNTTFNNFRCVVAGKTLTFEEGSTQTINGLFQIEGERSSSIRVILASSGGAGTTWNLVLNGKHDCNFVNSQGSNASGNTSLPINPAGYFNGGDNTNWYASSLPEDIIFYDNFENSTLSSASPDCESSHWLRPTWSDYPDSTVNTQNHTIGGYQSMYSSGGSAGKGTASWNNPGWGPVENAVAECWFYDDMSDGIGKRIWASVESSNGQEWAAIGISTISSSTKYSYHRGAGGSPQTTQATFIDRSIGWHKCTWIHDDNNITLYIDDIQIYQGPNSQLDNFSNFDFGCWGYDNPNGSTAMWFDDCIVYRSQHQSAYRWYENDDAENPTPIVAENIAITREINMPTRVRIQVKNDMTMNWGTDATYVGLQYRQGISGGWTNLGASTHWDYADGLGTDGAQIANALVTNTNIRNHFVESQPSTQISTASPADYSECDFSILANANAIVGSNYYFRMVITDASGNYLKSFAGYPFLAECQIESLSTWIWRGNISNDWNVSGNWNQATIPDATSNVIIQTGAVRNPRLNISGALAKSIFIQTGMTLLIDTPGTDLTISNNLTIHGTITHSSNTAILNLNAGVLSIDGGTYNHNNGVLNASNADIRIINQGTYNYNCGTSLNFKKIYIDNEGTFNDMLIDGTINTTDFSILGNGQFFSNREGTNYNILGNFINNGSMNGSTGGIFNFNGIGKTFSGTSSSHRLYKANINGTFTITTTKEIKILNSINIGSNCTFTIGENAKLIIGTH